MTQHTQSVATLDVSQDGTLLLAGALDSTVKLFRLEHMALLQTFG